MLKYLEPLKQFKLTEDQTTQAITKAYDFYQNRSGEKFTDEDQQIAVPISCLVRFFKCINSGKKIDEEFLQNYFKNDVFKQKPNSINYLNQCINSIKKIQSTRLLFSDLEVSRPLKSVPMRARTQGRNIKKVINIDFKIDVIISNDYSNRLLTPEITLVLTFDDNSTLKMKIDIRMFNELRKNLAFNIKKILENENVNLLK